MALQALICSKLSSIFQIMNDQVESPPAVPSPLNHHPLIPTTPPVIPPLVLITSDHSQKNIPIKDQTHNIISIDPNSDSDSQDCNRAQSPKKKRRGRQPKSDPVYIHLPKLKKPQQRCAKCGIQGKKKDFMRCKVCEENLHPQCYEGEGKNIKPKKYLCKLCKEKDREKKFQAKEKLKQQKLGEKIEKKQISLLSNGQAKVLEKKEPHPPKQDKREVVAQVQIPVEDSLIVQARPSLQIKACEEIYGSFDRFLQLQNFIMTFGQDMGMPKEFGREHLRVIIDKPHTAILHTLHQKIISIYLKDILDKNKTQNVKQLNQNFFFGLIGYLRDHQHIKQILPSVWPQILLHFRFIPSLSKTFQDHRYMELVEILANRGIEFYVELSGQEKVLILLRLFEGLYQVDHFHDLMNKKSELMHDLSKEKNESATEVKNNDGQIIQLQKKIQALQKSTEDPNQLKLKKDDRVKEQKRRREIKEMQVQQQRLRKQNQEIQERAQQIVEKLPFITTRIHFLGFDAKYRQYFFNSNHPNLIYIKDNSSWGYIEGQAIYHLISHVLNPRGVRQNNLLNSIKYYLDLHLIPKHLPQRIDPQLLHLQIADFENNLSIKKHDLCDRLEHEITVLCSLEEKFSLFLANRKCRWAPSAVRNTIRNDLLERVSIDTCLKTIMDMHQMFLFVEGIKEEGEEDDNCDRLSDISQELDRCKHKLKKIPIRLWGISSQKYKRFYLDYLQNCSSLCGLKLIIWVFYNLVEKYIARKIESDNLHKKKLTKTHNKVQVYDSPSEQSSSDHKPVVQQPQQIFKFIEPVRRSTRNRKANIVKDLQDDEEDDSEKHEQVCFECGEYGDVVCCDTCPKVFHKECLGLKEIPDGEWSCYKCMERLSTFRYTRSKARLSKLSQL